MLGGGTGNIQTLNPHKPLCKNIWGRETSPKKCSPAQSSNARPPPNPGGNAGFLLPQTWGRAYHTILASSPAVSHLARWNLETSSGSNFPDKTFQLSLPQKTALRQLMEFAASLYTSKTWNQSSRGLRVCPRAPGPRISFLQPTGTNPASPAAHRCPGLGSPEGEEAEEVNGG